MYDTRCVFGENQRQRRKYSFEMTLRLNKIAVIAAFFAALVVVGGGCIPEIFTGGANGGAVDPSDSLATYWDGPRVRPGVALSISVTAAGMNNREAKQYFVDAEGCITMELVGTIQCNKLTLIELQQKVANAYKEYYVDPSVTAVFNYTPGSNMVSPWGTVLVLGEVGKQGPVDMPATQELPLTRALQLAGGVTSVADKRNVKVTRCMEDGVKKRTVVDLVAIGVDGDGSKDMLLKAGDVVWVPLGWY